MSHDSPGGEDHAQQITELQMFEDRLWHSKLLTCLAASGITAEMQTKAALIVGEEMGKAREQIRPMHSGWSLRSERGKNVAEKDFKDILENTLSYVVCRLEDLKVPNEVIGAIAPIFQEEVQRRMGLPVKSAEVAGSTESLGRG